MPAAQPAKLLQIHLSERDRYKDQPLHEAIVARCRELSIAGATVFRGLEGYGESASIHRPHLITHDQPLIITIIDTEENLARLVPAVEEMLGTGLMTMSDVRLVRVG